MTERLRNAANKLLALCGDDGDVETAWQQAVADLRSASLAPSGEATEADDKRDAERWRKLAGIARMMTLGSAGTPTNHMGLDFWHEHPEASRPSTVAAFTDFVDRIPAPAVLQGEPRP